MMKEIDTVRHRIRTTDHKIEEISDGYIFTYSDLSIFDDLQYFIDHENECCMFLDFHITKDEKEITCEVILNNDRLDIENVKEVILALFTSE